MIIHKVLQSYATSAEGSSVKNWLLLYKAINLSIAHYTSKSRLFILVLLDFSVVVSPKLLLLCRIPEEGKFGRGEREPGDECTARIWQGWEEGHISAPVAGEAVTAWPDATLLLWRIGNSVTHAYWLWVSFWKKLWVTIFLIQSVCAQGPGSMGKHFTATIAKTISKLLLGRGG